MIGRLGLFAVEGEVSHVLLNCYATKETEEEAHAVEAFFAEGDGCVPEADAEQEDAEHDR